MKVQCLQENLSKGLNTVGRAVAVRTTLPITNNVLIATDQFRLKLVATNLEIATTCWINAKVDEEGVITIPARLLTDFVNSLPADNIDLTLKQNILELKCARHEARISGIDAEDFPPIPRIEDGIKATVSPDILREAISQVVFAIATEESRPVLTGVNVEFEDTSITFAAADGFRMAVHQAKLPEPISDKISIIIPGKSMVELNRLLADQEEPVEISVAPNKTQILFRLKNTELISQLIQGTYPNYKLLIPKSYTTRAVISISEFLRSAKTASIFARDASGIVKLYINPGVEVSPGEVTITARSEQIGDNLGKIDAVVVGDSAKIAFNSKYLIDVLGVLKGSEVALETTSPSSPGVIRPVSADNYTHVIMPMFVQW